MPQSKCLECHERHDGECSPRALKVELERTRNARRDDLQALLKLNRDLLACFHTVKRTDSALDATHGYLRRVRRVLRIILEEEHAEHVRGQLRGVIRKLRVFP